MNKTAYIEIRIDLFGKGKVEIKGMHYIKNKRALQTSHPKVTFKKINIGNNSKC
jgi:hypothetical protein